MFKNDLQRIIILTTAFFLLAASNTIAQSENKTEQLEWHTDLMKAHELSEKSKKPIFAFFTGSDWCGWCIKLQKEVFAKEAFIEWAKKNVILLELDFPRNKQLSPELTAQNSSMQQAFNVSGYPAVWIFKTIPNKKEKKFSMDIYGSLGYPVGAEQGKEEVKFLETAQEIFLKKLLDNKSTK